MSMEDDTKKYEDKYSGYHIAIDTPPELPENLPRYVDTLNLMDEYAKKPSVELKKKMSHLISLIIESEVKPVELKVVDNDIRNSTLDEAIKLCDNERIDYESDDEGMGISRMRERIKSALLSMKKEEKQR